MKTRNEQPSFKQKADSKAQNKADSRMSNKTESRLDNCSCSNESKGMKGDMRIDSRLENCSRKDQ